MLRVFTEKFKSKYGVECVSALHHNKSKTNYHIHLIFSERRVLENPVEKVATRAMYYNEDGKRLRTKKEVYNEDGTIKPRCKVIPKGEVYEKHIFDKKDPLFKSRAFLRDTKEFYTELINQGVAKEKDKLKVFDKNDIYLPQKKIGKGNPLEAEIIADNESRRSWNRLAEYAVQQGVPKEKVVEMKNEEVSSKVAESIRTTVWMPTLFQNIINTAKAALEKYLKERLWEGKREAEKPEKKPSLLAKLNRNKEIVK